MITGTIKNNKVKGILAKDKQIVTPPKEETLSVQPVESGDKITKFIIVAHDKDCSGLGFAKILKEGNTGRGYNPDWDCSTVEVLLTVIKDADDLEPEYEKAIEMIGDGIVDKIDWEELYAKRDNYRDFAWIWDGNHNSEIADELRGEGYTVFGATALSDASEHDREYGLSLIERAQLETAEFHEFNDIKAGIAFMEANEGKSYVFKPDEPDCASWVTMAPDSDNDHHANKEIRRFLESQGTGKGKFILQQRVKGIELNVEMWLYKGQPFFAHGNLESKRKHNGDLGKMIGCAMDVEFIIPLHCKVLQETVWKLCDLPEFQDFTGFLDMNIIVADNKYYFLEFCQRWGYNSHCNLFLTLSLSPMSEIMSDFILGNTENFNRHFRSGFGTSITCLIDNPVHGLPLMFGDHQDVESRFYHFDSYKKNDEFFLAGTGNEVGIQCAHDYDLKSSAEECLRKFHKVHFSGKFGRTDLALTDYQSNPIERLIACNAMRLFEL